LEVGGKVRRVREGKSGEWGEGGLRLSSQERTMSAVETTGSGTMPTLASSMKEETLMARPMRRERTFPVSRAG
jgi:hypothetical protein